MRTRYSRDRARTRGSVGHRLQFNILRLERGHRLPYKRPSRKCSATMIPKSDGSQTLGGPCAPEMWSLSQIIPTPVFQPSGIWDTHETLLRPGIWDKVYFTLCHKQYHFWAGGIRVTVKPPNFDGIRDTDRDKIKSAAFGQTYWYMSLVLQAAYGNMFALQLRDVFLAESMAPRKGQAGVSQTQG